jgi:putative heme-binding domain-containing protein
VIAGGKENMNACARLFDLAPNVDVATKLFNGLQEGLRGRDLSLLPPELLRALKRYNHLFKEETLALDVRMQKPDAIQKALKVVADQNAAVASRLLYIRLFGELDIPASVEVLLRLVESNTSSPSVKIASILSLENYNDDQIGSRVVKAYPDKLRADYNVRDAAMSLFASRNRWAMELLNAIAKQRQPGEDFIANTIDRSDVPGHTIRQLTFLNDTQVKQLVLKLWPEAAGTTASEKNAAIESVKRILTKNDGDAAAGRPLFMAHCGTCHKLFDEGRNIGPDLTGYDRNNIDDLLVNIVDPSAYIREGYAAHHLVTRNGRNVIGTLVSKTPESVTLQPMTGEPVTISARYISSMTLFKISIMPERLLNNMSEKQLRDLFTYMRKSSS